MNNPYLRTICTWDWWVQVVKRDFLAIFLCAFLCLPLFFLLLLPLERGFFNFLLIIKFGVLISLLLGYSMGEIWKQFHSNPQFLLLPHARKHLQIFIQRAWLASLFLLIFLFAIKLSFVASRGRYLILPLMACVSMWGLWIGSKGGYRSNKGVGFAMMILFCDSFWNLIPEPLRLFLQPVGSKLLSLNHVQFFILPLVLLAFGGWGLLLWDRASKTPSWRLEESKEKKIGKLTWLTLAIRALKPAWLTAKENDFKAPIRPVPKDCWGRGLFFSLTLNANWLPIFRFGPLLGVCFIWFLFFKLDHVFMEIIIPLVSCFILTSESFSVVEDYLCPREFLLPAGRERFVKDRLMGLFLFVGKNYSLLLLFLTTLVLTSKIFGKGFSTSESLAIILYWTPLWVGMPSLLILKWLYQKLFDKGKIGFFRLLVEFIWWPIVITISPFMAFIDFSHHSSTFLPAWLLPFSLVMLSLSLFFNWVAYRQLCKMEFD